MSLYAWSEDEERYHGPFDSVAAALTQAERDGVESDFVWVGECYHPHAEDYVDAHLVLDHIVEQEEYCIDAADGWPNATTGQKAELTRLLQQTVGDWLDRHKLRERFFLVRDTVKHQLPGRATKGGTK